jgi:hypothetical protein
MNMSIDKVLDEVKGAVEAVVGSRDAVVKAQEAVDKAKAACEKTTADAQVNLDRVREVHEKAVVVAQTLHESFSNQLANFVPGINKK